MAQVFAIASGNFNNSAIWDGGSVPTSADDVFANGFTVTLNANATVNSLRNTTSTIFVPAISTPAMTGATTPSGIVTASAGSGAFNAFDQNLTFGYTSTAANAAFVQYQFPTGKTIVRYMLHTGSIAGRHPATWTFQGSNDGSTWTTLHSITGASLATSAAYHYSFVNTTSYTYYRINVTAVLTAGQQVAILELQMSESSYSGNVGIAGGSFVLSDGVTFTSTNGIVAGNTTPVVSYAGSTSATLYISLTLTNLANVIHIDHTGTGTLTMYGNIAGSGFSITGSITGVRVTSNGTFTMNGSFVSLSSANSNAATIRGIDVTGSTSTININGSINGPTMSGTGSGTFHPIYVGVSNVNINVVGNINGGVRTISGNAALSTAIDIRGSANVVVSGNVTGGSAGPNTTTATHGIYSLGGTITVNGDVTGGTGLTDGLSCGIRAATVINVTGTVSSNTCQAILCEGNSNVTITGNVTANNSIAVSSTATTATNNIAGNVTAVNFPGVYASSSSQNIITGYLTNGTSGAMAFWGQKLFLSTSGSRTWTFNTPSAATKILYTADLLSPAGSQPAVTDVRSGTVYALGTLTGTCVIPPKNSVTAGVPVDNTVGTALLTLSTLQTYAQAAWNTQTSAITTSGSIGERLKEASTVAITGQQIAGFDI